nr:porin [Rhizobium cauense]
MSLDDLPDDFTDGPNDYGVSGQIYGKYGPVSGYLLASYDQDSDEVAIRAIGYADIGPGQLAVYGLWASGAN